MEEYAPGASIRQAAATIAHLPGGVPASLPTSTVPSRCIRLGLVAATPIQ